MYAFFIYLIFSIMSETVHFKWKLTRVELTWTLEEKCEQFMKSKSQVLPEWHSKYKESVEDSFYKEIVILNDELYSVEMESFSDDQDIFTSKNNDDWTIDFDIRYYNGWCSFDEAIGYAVK